MRPTDEEILAGFESKSLHELVWVAADLAQSLGSSGVPVLRQFLEASGPGSEHLRCTAMVSLARRCRAEAGEVLLRTFTENTGALREYAGEALLEVADGRVWNDLLEWYEEWLTRPKSRRRPIPPAMPLSYLVVHAAEDPAQALRLVEMLRSNWHRLLVFEQRWIQDFAPQVRPEGGPAGKVSLPKRNELPFPDSGFYA